MGHPGAEGSSPFSGCSQPFSSSETSPDIACHPAFRSHSITATAKLMSAFSWYIPGLGQFSDEGANEVLGSGRYPFQTHVVLELSPFPFPRHCGLTLLSIPRCPSPEGREWTLLLYLSL